MNDATTTAEVMQIAAKVKKAAVLKKVFEDYPVPQGSDRTTFGKVEVEQIGSGPPGQIQLHANPQTGQIDIRTPGGWQNYMSQFDWIESKFKEYLTRGEITKIEPPRNSIAAARRTLQSHPLGMSDDPLEGHKETIAKFGEWTAWDVGSEEKSETWTAYMQYMNRMKDREANIVAALESLWHAANADRTILAMQYSRLVVIGANTIGKLTGTGGDAYNPNSKISYAIAGAIIGTAAATVASGGPAVPVMLAMAAGGASIGSEAFGSDKKTIQKDQSATINAKGRTAEKKDIEIEGVLCQDILQSMWNRMGDMEKEVRTAIAEVNRSLNTTLENVSKNTSAGHPLVGPRLALAEAASNGKVRSLMN